MQMNNLLEKSLMADFANDLDINVTAAGHEQHEIHDKEFQNDAIMC